MTTYESNRQRADRMKRSENNAAHDERMASFRKSEESARLRKEAEAEHADPPAKAQAPAESTEE
jgi:hypothetical protein